MIAVPAVSAMASMPLMLVLIIIAVRFVIALMVVMTVVGRCLMVMSAHINTLCRCKTMWPDCHVSAPR